MSLKLRSVLLVGGLFITVAASAENGGQQPTANVATNKAAVAVALPEAPAAEKKPVAKREKPLGIRYGIDGRLRSDNSNNISDQTNTANDESRFYRFLTRVNMGVDFPKGIEGYVRIANEPYKKTYNTCTATPTNLSTCYTTNNANYGKSISLPFSAMNIWFDSAYLKFNKLPMLPNTTLQVGRFDMQRGDGFFIWNGIPGAGPKAGYFDGILLTHKRGKQTFDLFGSWNPATEQFYPVINRYYAASPTVGKPTDYILNDMGDLVSTIGYYQNRQLKSTDIDGFYGYFRQYDMIPKDSTQATPYSSAMYSQYQFQPNRNWNAFGGRIVHRLPSHIVAHFNYEYQYGTQASMSQAHGYLFREGEKPTVATAPLIVYPKVELRAYAYNFFINKYFKFKTRPYIGFVTEYLSGNDPKTPTVDRNFFQGYGEWTNRGAVTEEGYKTPSPFGDSDGTSVTKEIGYAPSRFSNYVTYNARAGFTPWQGKVRKVEVGVEYHYVDAPHPFMANAAHYNQNPAANATAAQLLTPTIGIQSFPVVFTNNTLNKLHRWDNYRSEVNFTLSKAWTGYVYWDHYVYGNFYNSTWQVTNPKVYNGPKVTATRASVGDFVRITFNYRYNGFLPYKKGAKGAGAPVVQSGGGGD